MELPAPPSRLRLFPLRTGERRLLAGVVVVAVAATEASARGPPPMDRSGAPQHGVASFYGPGEAGRPTASGRPMKPDALTAASRTLPLGTRAKVTNTENGKAVTVTITDRGPYVQDRVVDVTPRAADALGMKARGVAGVEVKPLSEPPPPR